MWVRARIERNCVGNEFFVANLTFDEIYKRATKLAQEIADKNGLGLNVDKAGHSLMLHPEVRRFLDAEGVDYIAYNICFPKDNVLYFFNPQEGTVLNVTITDQELLDLVSL